MGLWDPVPRHLAGDKVDCWLAAIEPLICGTPTSDTRCVWTSILWWIEWYSSWDKWSSETSLENMTAEELFWPTTKSMLQTNTRQSKAIGRLAHSRRRGYHSPLGPEVAGVVDYVADSGGSRRRNLRFLSFSRSSPSLDLCKASPLHSALRPSLAHRSKGCFLATAIARLLPRQPRDRKGEERAQTKNLRAPQGGVFIVLGAQ
jgi:hypothetical protein